MHENAIKVKPLYFNGFTCLSGGVSGITVEHLIPVLTFFGNIKCSINNVFADLR